MLEELVSPFWTWLVQGPPPLPRIALTDRSTGTIYYVVADESRQDGSGNSLVTLSQAPSPLPKNAILYGPYDGPPLARDARLYAASGSVAYETIPRLGAQAAPVLMPSLQHPTQLWNLIFPPTTGTTLYAAPTDLAP